MIITKKSEKTILYEEHRKKGKSDPPMVQQSFDA
jgi:hypothetical protein